jgi:membrane protein required for colicin V production
VNVAGVDWIILAVIGVSALVSFIRGFFKEAISLLTWVGAGIVTLLFTSKFKVFLPDSIESPTARLAISGLVLFFGCMLVGALANWLFSKAIGPSTLGFTDRLIGIFFGAARGGVIVATIVLLANLVPTLKQETWWQASVLLPRIQVVAEFIHTKLPEDLAHYFDFTPPSI